MKKLIPYLLILLVLSSCAIRFRKNVEITIENQNSLETYLNKFDIGTEHLYTLKNFFAYKQFYFTENKKMGLTDVLFFNSNGYLVKE